MDLQQQSRYYALDNAVKYDGKAALGKIIQRLMANHPELRSRAKEVKEEAGRAVEWANSMSLEEQKAFLEQMGGGIEIVRKERKGLVPLKGDVDNGVVMRFAPGPSGPLHLGHSRAVILNDEYCKRYNGKFILRLEDTNPSKIDPDAYDMIPEDLEWLGVKVDETYIQSDRFDLYYRVARELLEKGAAYICTCDAEHWRSLKNSQLPCPHRELPPDEQLEMWERMLDREFEPHKASYIVKTDLHHRNPAVRDFVGLRILNGAHPRTGKEHGVYPLYNFSVAVDDHFMGCTHVLRGKDHLNNTRRQEFIYDAMGWKRPEFIHYGWVSIEGTLLKTSLIKEGIDRGEYQGWDDVRLGTFRALKARGFRPEALRRYWKEVGTKQVDIKFSWDNLASMNRELVDESTIRIFYVKEPVEVSVRCDNILHSHAPYHPSHPGMGIRAHELVPEDGVIRLLLESGDLVRVEPGEVLRLKDLGNIRPVEEPGAVNVFEYIGDDLEVIRNNARIVHWVPVHGSMGMELFVPDDAGSMKVFHGELESFGADCRGLVQFERIGFANIVGPPGEPKALFCHK